MVFRRSHVKIFGVIVVCSLLLSCFFMIFMRNSPTNYKCSQKITEMNCLSCECYCPTTSPTLKCNPTIVNENANVGNPASRVISVHSRNTKRVFRHFDYSPPPSPLFDPYLFPIAQKTGSKSNPDDIYFLLNYEDFSFDVSSCGNLEFMVDHYREIMFPKGSRESGTVSLKQCPQYSKCISNVVLNVKNPSVYQPTVDMNERFAIRVDTDILVVDCDEIFGCYHSLERIAQLTNVDIDGRFYLDNFFPIEDYPRFTHRGILIDTARHYLPVKKIKNIIRSVRYSSLNVIHWHMVDDQSFPVVIEKRPSLHLNGAYSMEKIYTVADIKDIVEYATKFGVRIYPEIDLPGHASSFCRSGLDICPNPVERNWRLTLDPTKELTYEVIEDVVSQLSGLFPEPIFHFGGILFLFSDIHVEKIGDEVDFACWEDNDDVQNRARKLNLRNSKGMLDYFAKRLLEILEKYDLIPMWYVPKISFCAYWRSWEDFGPAKSGLLGSNVIIQTWEKGETTAKFVEKGVKTVSSPAWYLDLFNYETWATYYTYEPLQNYKGKNRNMLLGGEAAAWGEHITSLNWDSLVFPGLILASERLWKNEDNYYYNPPLYWGDAVVNRVDTFVCELNRRGINASPLKWRYCPYD